MTAISTIISKQCIAVSTDSYITDCTTGLPRVDKKRSKITEIRALRAAAAYWGLAETTNGWTTKAWLEAKAIEAQNFGTLEGFAIALHEDLAKILSGVGVDDRGIGIHLMGYERVGDYWVPELFLISNYADTTYSKLCCLHKSRETIHIAFKEQPNERHREPEYRYKLKGYLAEGGMLVFNNGDPSMFNPAATAVLRLLKKARERGVLRDSSSTETYRALARLPIKIVSEAQRDFYRKDKRRVGGKIHDLVITPAGQFSHN